MTELRVPCRSSRGLAALRGVLVPAVLFLAAAALAGCDSGSTSDAGAAGAGGGTGPTLEERVKESKAAGAKGVLAPGGGKGKIH